MNLLQHEHMQMHFSDSSSASESNEDHLPGSQLLKTETIGRILPLSHTHWLEMH